MNKKTLSAVLASLACLLLVIAHAESPGSAVTISRIQIEPGLLTAKVIFETNAPLAVQSVYYLPDSPKTLVIDVNKATTAEAPLVPASESQLIRDIQVQKAGSQDLRFFLRLSERVPCRIVNDSARTVLELTKFQRGQAGYLIDADTQAQLDRRPKNEIYLSGFDYTKGTDSISFHAQMTDQAVTQVFALENPPRLVVDLFDTVLTAKNDVCPVDAVQATVQRARVGQFQLSNPRAITRMVFDLKEPGLYAVNSAKDGLVVSFFPPAAGIDTSAKIAAAAPELVAPPVNESAVQKPAAIVAEAKKIVPPTVDPQVQPDLKPEIMPTTNPETKPPAKPEAKAETKPAAKPAAVDPPCPPRDPDPAIQEKKTVSTEEQREKFKPKTIANEEEKYSGEVISLRFKDADLRDVILYLAQFADLNVIFDPDVRAVVTCDLRSIPWDQALDIILRQYKMGKSIEGNVLRIAPIGVLTREQEDQLKLKDSQELAGPVQVKTVALSYSKAKDVAALISTKKSSRGEIIIDERTNTLLITDVKDRLDLIEKLIAVVDTPTPQVTIEARIVEASTNFIRNLGIQWGFKGIADPYYGNQTSLQFPNKININGAMIPTGQVTEGIGGPLGGYAVNLPAPSFNAALGFSFANVLDSFRLDVALSALETAGEGRIISHPKITTQNNLQAEIIRGRQIPVQTVANFTVTTRYVQASLQLRATPQITAEGTIIMTIEIQNDAADFANLVNGVPPITTQSAKTTVMVPDGGTTVIGGIYRVEDSITRQRVPFLAQIPILGTLFKNYARNKTDQELLIFITPRILK